MQNDKYIRWEDYYKDNFKRAYSDFFKYISEDKLSVDILFVKYRDLFTSSMNTLYYLLVNKGIFKTAHRDIIRTGYYIEFLDDGQKWIDALTIIENFEQAYAKQLLMLYCTDEYLDIFKSLDKKFYEMEACNAGSS